VNESLYIKPLIFGNAPDEKNLTQMGGALGPMPGKNGVCDKTMKVPKSEVAGGSCL